MTARVVSRALGNGKISMIMTRMKPSRGKRLRGQNNQ